MKKLLQTILIFFLLNYCSELIYSDILLKDKIHIQDKYTFYFNNFENGIINAKNIKLISNMPTGNMARFDKNGVLFTSKDFVLQNNFTFELLLNIKNSQEADINLMGSYRSVLCRLYTYTDQDAKLILMLWSQGKMFQVKTIPILQSNKLYYIAVSYSKLNDISIYINGIKLKKEIFEKYEVPAGEIDSSTKEFLIGEKFCGEMDEIKISSVDRSRSEIESYYEKLQKLIIINQRNQVEGITVSKQILAVPTFESCGLYIPYNDAKARCELIYTEKGNNQWKKTFPLIYNIEQSQFCGSIVNLREETTYEVKSMIFDGEKLVNTSKTEFKTWSNNSHVGKVIKIESISSNRPIIISEKGNEKSWIKILGHKNFIVDLKDESDCAILIKNSNYLILENIIIKGGERYGIDIQNSENIRIINCDISGFGRIGEQDFSKDGKFYAKNGRPIDYDTGININKSGKVVIERCYIHDPRTTSNTWKYSHPAGPHAVIVRTTGNNVIRYNDFIGSDKHRWNDGIGGWSNGTETGGFRRDSDIYGNMIAFGNDDGMEIDGGQMNVRVYLNKIEGFLCGISTAPCVVGPSYIFRNIITNLGDETGFCGSGIKNGGGSTYSKGRTYFFNNTIYVNEDGITGVGYGNDKDRTSFNAVTRNNIVFSINGRSGIIDWEKGKDNDFNYDLLFTNNSKKNQNPIIAVSGSEKNGIFEDPLFINKNNADFRLSGNSPAIDKGLIINNFSDTYSGKNPDLGALEYKSVQLIPYRPINIRVDKYQVNFNIKYKEENFSDFISVTTGKIEKGYNKCEIKINNAFDWFKVEPSKLYFNSNSKYNFKISINNKININQVNRGIFLIKFENGYSIPISVYVKNSK